MRFRTGQTTCLTALLTAGMVVSAAEPGDAAIIYVDNRRGSDIFDGTASRPISDRNGPLRTIRRSLELARAGDTIVLANNEIPYDEPILLFGARHSGFEHARFTIVGNGSVIDGSRPVPPYAWRQVGKNLWKLKPYRKGYYQLLLDDKPVPEMELSAPADVLPAIADGHWCAWKGAIFYQAVPLEFPAERPFRFAYHDVGLGMYRVHDVQILDLTFRHFRLDGISSPDFCRQIMLENLASAENGRAGIAVGGTSELVLRNCRVQGNRRHDVLQSEFGSVRVEDAQAGAAADATN